MDIVSTCNILRLWAPASLQALTDWTRPLAFNLFTSSNIKSSTLEINEAALEEDAVGLAVMSLNLLLFATAYGFNGAIDSYASVAFGAKDCKELSAILLRQLILLCALALVAALLLLNAESLFLVIGVRSELAARSAQLLHLMSCAVPGDFAYDCMARWMRGQQLHRLVSACSIAALGISLVINITLMDPDAPTRGPLLALIAQNTVLPLLLGAAYCYGSRASLEAALADPPSTEDLIGPRLWRQLRTAIAAMVWTCAELWAWEVQVFEAAHLGTGNAAAYTLLSTTYSLLISAFPISAASAVSALMGEALGQGEPRRALTLLHSGCALTLLLVIGYTTLMFFGRFWVASVLCGGVADVAAAYTRTLPLVLSMHFMDGLFNMFKQWLVLRRKQAFGAVMSLVVYYCIGVPIGIYLAFWRGWGLLGLWSGLGLAVFLGVVAAGVQAVLDIAELVGVTGVMDNGRGLSEEPSSDYVRFEALLGHQNGASAASSKQASPAGHGHVSSSWWQGRAKSFVWLGLLLVPGVTTFGAAVATPVDQPHIPMDTPEVSQAPATDASSLLLGASRCSWSTGGDFYEYPFTAFWNGTSGDYGWEVRIADRSRAVTGSGSGRRLQTTRTRVASDIMPDGLLRFGSDKDVYDTAYGASLGDEVEVGWAAWLTPPVVREDPGAPGEWTASAFVGTRVSTGSSTFCGCQTMRGDGRRFRLTEHGRAQIHIPIVPVTVLGATPAWYLNLTRREINAQIRSTCAPISERTPCPVDNATAWAEWEAGRDNGTYWVLPPWVEVYETLPHEV